MVEMIILIAAGALVIPSMLVALWVYVKLIEIRDRNRAIYRFSGSIKFEEDTYPDLREHDVRIEKIHKGYRLNFYDGDILIYTVILEKVDQT